MLCDLGIKAFTGQHILKYLDTAFSKRLSQSIVFTGTERNFGYSYNE